MRSIQRLLLAILFVGALAAPASAQVYITPTVGGYVPASDFQTLRGEARDARIERSATMALGMNLELGALRGSLAYVTGTELTEDGVADRGAIGDGSMLAGSLGLVVRPIPRILRLQPYVLGGAGFKRYGYSYNDDGFSIGFPEDKTDFALHFGVGADLMLGRLGVMAEFTDFVSRDDGWGPHDGFATIGLKLRLF